MPKTLRHWCLSFCSWLLVLSTGCTNPEPPPQSGDVYGPTGNCVTLHDLLRNRPYPPAHGVHSYANDVPICD